MRKLLFFIALIPSLAFGQVAVGPGSVFTGSVAGQGGGGGSGPYSPTSFTVNALLTGGGTGSINAIGVSGTGNALTALNSITSVALSPLVLATGTFGTAVTFASATGIPTFAALGTGLAYSTSGAFSTLSVTGSGNALTALNSITAAASTDLTLNAGSGANNAINLYLPGTGPVRIGASGGTYASAAALAIASSTSATAGIGWGTDCTLYRSGSNTLTLNSYRFIQNGLSNGTAGAPVFYIEGASDNSDLETYFDASNTYLGPFTNTPLKLVQNNGTLMATITSTAATFAGNTSTAGLTLTGATNAGTVTLSSGAGTITDASIATTSTIILTLVTASGANAHPQILANAGSATITGLATDSGTYNWRLIK